MSRHFAPFTNASSLSAHHALAILLIAGPLLVGCFPELPPEEDDTTVDVSTPEPDADAPDAVPDTVDPEVVPPDLSEPEVTLPDLREPDADEPPDDIQEPDVVPDIILDDIPDIIPDDIPDDIPDISVDAVEDSSEGDADQGDTTPEPELNACGGLGTLDGPEPGGPCGICGDGLAFCDPTDPAKNRSLCANASSLNACEGCGPLDAPLESDCLECGRVVCDPDHPGQTTCVEPAAGCTVPLSCAELGCLSQQRDCEPATETEDAFCLGCLPGFVDVEGVCLRQATTPSNLQASRDRTDGVALTWDASDGATAYRVYRCSDTNCAGEGAWTLVPNGQVAVTSYTDTQTAAAPQPGAPSVSATSTSAAHVTVSWAAVAAATAPTYRYRVTAVAPAGETAPTPAVTGSRADRPVQGYELSIDGGGWIQVGDNLSWRDDGAPAATLSGGTATASQGTIATHVALAVSGIQATPGQSRGYRVRAITDTGTSAASASANGRRAAPTSWTITWERSAGPSDSDYSLLAGATGNTWNDTGAPSDGTVRYYRAVASATHAVTGRSPAVAGSRQPPPGIPGNVRATSDLADRVEVRWSQVSDAIGYHVYRNGQRITTGSGLSPSTLVYADDAAPAPPGPWQAPTGLTATNDDSDIVQVRWTAPTRPQGAIANYQVRAVNQAGEGELSGAVQGRRSLPALASYEVQSAWTGTAASWTDTQTDEVTWTHAEAPAGEITLGTISATDGDHRAHVALTANGQSVAPRTVTYRVRGILEDGSRTPSSGPATGSRAVGALQMQWQRSAGTIASSFADIAGATQGTFLDTSAPATGVERHYRLRLSAPGASSRTTASQLGRRLALEQVSAGYQHTCAVAVGGRVWCWGQQQHGRLGNGQTSSGNVTTPVAVQGLSEQATHVSAGGTHTCARFSGGGVRCWGSNASGQIGDGTETTRATPVEVSGLENAVSVTAGSAFSCATLSDQTVRCWGNNTAYQLANGSTVNSSVPVTAMATSSIPLGQVTAVDAGFALLGGIHACARRTSGNVRCWGYPHFLPDLYWGWLGSVFTTYSGYPLSASGLSNFASVTAGGLHSCGVTDTGELYCWGWNEHGQLGLGDTNDRGIPNQVSIPSGFTPQSKGVAAGSVSTCLLSTAGTVRCWGRTPLGGNRQTVPSANLSGISSATQLSVGDSHACVVEGRAVKCWGNGRNGRLGAGSTGDSTTPVMTLFP